MSAPKQRTPKLIHQNDLKTGLPSAATTLLHKRETISWNKNVNGDARASGTNAPFKCGVTGTNLTASEPSTLCSSLKAAPTGKQRTVSPAESVNEISREAPIANLKRSKGKKSSPSQSSGSQHPDIWEVFESRPRTALPKKERTVPIPIMTMKIDSATKKTPKKRKLADRLPAFGPEVVSVAAAQVSDAVDAPMLYKTISPAKESATRDPSNADSTDVSLMKIKKKHNKNKPIEPKPNFSEPLIVNRKLETLNRSVSPTKVNLKNVNKLEPVMEEEPVSKNRKKVKSKKKIELTTTENQGNVLHKTSLRQSDELNGTQSKGKDGKKRKVSLIDSPTSLETGSLVVKHDSTNEKKISKLSNEVNDKKYPVLTDVDLIRKFLGVTLTNNQKGRIRQVLKEVFQGTDTAVLPDVIHNKIQSILKSSSNLTDTDLRKIRVLFNMLKLAVEAQRQSSETLATRTGKSKVKSEVESKLGKEDKEKTEQLKKIKEPKRYVVFIGNLPPGIDKETILDHFSDIKNYIKDVRIPKREENTKSAIAYVELMNKSTYEMALSKHHSMLGSKRINVLFTTQKNSKISKAEAKGKTAKLVAMVKSGQLVGSVALKKKRSQRRAKLRIARRKIEEKGL